MFVIIFFYFYNSARTASETELFFSNRNTAPPPCVPTVLPKSTRLLDELYYTRGQYRRNCAHIEKLNFITALQPSLCVKIKRPNAFSDTFSW